MSICLNRTNRTFTSNSIELVIKFGKDERDMEIVKEQIEEKEVRKEKLTRKEKEWLEETRRREDEEKKEQHKADV